MTENNSSYKSGISHNSSKHSESSRFGRPHIPRKNGKNRIKGNHSVYELGDTIGRGSFGIVRLAYPLDTQRFDGFRYPVKEVVVKMPPGDVRDKKLTKSKYSIQQELDVYEKLQSTGLVKLIDSGHIRHPGYKRSKVPFMVQERLYPLHEPMNLMTALDIFVNVLYSIKDINRKYILRDIKRDNILLRIPNFRNRDSGQNIPLTLETQVEMISKSAFEPVLVDMGIAITRKEAVNPKLDYAGSPIYTAPEVFTRNRVGPPADMYAAGCLLYELVTGDTPYEHEMRGIKSPRKILETILFHKQGHVSPVNSQRVRKIIEHSFRNYFIDPKNTLKRRKDSVDHIVEDLLALLTGCLDPYPTRRFTVRQAISFCEEYFDVHQRLTIPKTRKPLYDIRSGIAYAQGRVPWVDPEDLVSLYKGGTARIRRNQSSGKHKAVSGKFSRPKKVEEQTRDERSLHEHPQRTPSGRIQSPTVSEESQTDLSLTTPEQKTGVETVDETNVHESDADSLFETEYFGNDSAFPLRSAAETIDLTFGEGFFDEETGMKSLRDTVMPKYRVPEDSGEYELPEDFTP